MSKLIYINNTSLDGYVEDETGAFDWIIPIKFTSSSLNWCGRWEPICMGGDSMRRWLTGMRRWIIFDRTKVTDPALSKWTASEGSSNADDYFWLNPKTGRTFDDVKKAFISACGTRGLSLADARATYGMRLGEVAFKRIRHRQVNRHANFNESALHSQFASWQRYKKYCLSGLRRWFFRGTSF
jgi:hypothetical protein